MYPLKWPSSLCIYRCSIFTYYFIIHFKEHINISSVIWIWNKQIIGNNIREKGMASVEKALLMLRNLPRIGLNTIRDLPEAAKNRKAQVITFITRLVLERVRVWIEVALFSIFYLEAKMPSSNWAQTIKVKLSACHVRELVLANQHLVIWEYQRSTTMRDISKSFTFYMIHFRKKL